MDQQGKPEAISVSASNPSGGLLARKDLLIAAVLLSVFAVAFGSTLQALFVQWSGVESEGYSHGFLVLACALYLIYSRRAELAALTPQPRPVALVPLLLLSLLWFAGKVAGVQLLQMALLPALLLCGIYAALGAGYLKIAFMPLVILMFALPIWQPTLPLLQDITTAVTHFNLEAIGRPVYVVGNYVYVSGGSFVIEEACSGLRFLLVAITLSLLNSTLNFHNARQTLQLLALAVGLSFLANWIRVLAVILIGDYTRMEHPIVEDHANFGWVLFLVFVLVPYFLVNRRFPVNPAPAAESAPQAARGRGGWGVVAMSFVALAVGPLLFGMSSLRGDETAPMASLPPSLAGRQLLTGGTAAWTPAYRNATQLLFARYAGTPVLELHMAHYPSQSQEAELINVNNLVADGETWSVVPGSEGEVALDAPAPLAKVQTLRVANRGLSRKIWYWYQVGGHHTSSRYQAKLWQMLAFLQGRGDASFIAIASDCADDCAMAEAGLPALAHDLAGQLP